MNGMNFTTSPRCASKKRGRQCRLREDGHELINGSLIHKWWTGRGDQGMSFEWGEEVYLNADNYATRMSERLRMELAELRRERKVSDAFTLGVEWARRVVEGADVMQEAS